MPTVIIGAGIIGLSTAYYLSSSEITGDIHVIEASPELFASASGKAAGFLARDWFTPSLAQLGELSFDLHRQLAKEHDGYETWGYTRSSGSSLEEQVGIGGDWLNEGTSRVVAAKKTARDNSDDPAWLNDSAALDIMSNGETTAQVSPMLLCQFLYNACTSRGVHVHYPARAISLSRSPSGALDSITMCNTCNQETSVLPCTKLVLAAGAWTSSVFRTLFPKSKVKFIPITSLAGHSLVVKSSHWPPPKLDKTESDDPIERQECHAVFTTDAEAGYSPEIFSRMPDGHIYLAGLNSPTYALPKIANEGMIDAESMAVLKKTAHKLLGSDFEIVRESVCWRPVTKKGVPIICSLADKGEDGVFVGAGHGAWGITNSLGTGFCIAEMTRGKDMSHYVGRLGF